METSLSARPVWPSLLVAAGVTGYLLDRTRPATRLLGGYCAGESEGLLLRFLHPLIGAYLQPVSPVIRTHDGLGVDALDAK